MSIQVILEKLALLDVALFNFINNTLYSNWLADFTYMFARDQLILIFLITAVLLYIGWRGWERVLPLAVWSTLAVIVANLLQNHLLKPFFNRARPFITLEQIHLSAPLRDISMVSLSFPSTHAASSAALAVLVIKLDSSCGWPAIGFALIIGFFTIYSGGHYPLDVLAGYSVGIVIGWGLTYLSRVIWPGEKWVHYQL